MTHIAVIGAGLIGRSWAIVFARGGHEVYLFDNSPKQASEALSAIDASLADMHKAGLIEDADGVRARIRIASELQGALKDAEHVQECVPEVLDLK